MWVWWKFKKSKHLKLPASVAAQYLLVSCPPPLLATSLLSLWNPVSRNDKLLVLQKCARGTQTGAQFPSEIFFSNTAQYFRNILAIISNSPPCLQQNRPEKDSGMGHTVCLKAVWYWEQARFMREVWSDWKTLWSEGLIRLEKLEVWSDWKSLQSLQLQKHADTGNPSGQVSKYLASVRSAQGR